MLNRLPRWAADIVLGGLTMLVGALLNREISRVDNTLQTHSTDLKKIGEDVATIRGFLQAKTVRLEEPADTTRRAALLVQQ